MSFFIKEYKVNTKIYKWYLEYPALQRIPLDKRGVFFLIFL